MFKKIILVVVVFALTIHTVSYFEHKKSIETTINTNLIGPKKDLDDPKALTIAWVGDMVPSENIIYNNSVFKNTAEFLTKPDIMIGNLEGTFAKEGRVSKCFYGSNLCHAFRGQKGFAEDLKNAGFDVVSLVNNHSYDFGKEGLVDTEDVLSEAGLNYISSTKPTLEIVVKGKKIGILGVSSTQPERTILDYEFIKEHIKKLKEENDIVILIFHGGAEGSDKTAVTGKYEYLGNENRGNVELVAQTAIDAGADIVFGSGPHVLRKIQYYKNRPIIYSAGNFVGGNEKLITKGTLGISGIFNISIIDGIFSNTTIPIVLSKDGVPSLDLNNQAGYLLTKLGQ